MTRLFLTLIAATALGATGLAATATAQPGKSGDRERRGPPPEAIEACADLDVGDTCSVELRDGETHAGTCAAGPVDDAPLACRPDDAPERPDKERPQR